MNFIEDIGSSELCLEIVSVLGVMDYRIATYELLRLYISTFFRYGEVWLILWSIKLQFIVAKQVSRWLE